MTQTVYKLYGSTSGGGSSPTQLDIQKSGRIEAISLDIAVEGADALNDGGTCEVSFSSATSATVNDTRSSLIGFRSLQGFLTTGGGPTGKCVVVTGLDIAVSAGERVWLHFAAVGTVVLYVTAYIYVNDGTGFRIGR